MARLRARRIVVTGRVQGVAYRAHTEQRARSLGLAGWVRNRRDGSVELVAQGDAESVMALEAWCRKGPGTARVDGVEAHDAPIDVALTRFSIAPTVDG